MSCAPFLSAARLLLLLCLALAWPAVDEVRAHGGVVEDDDMCVINIGFYRAHFKIYLPRSQGHEEYCEDLPEVGEAIFVMEYIHPGLSEVPMEFRIIRNVTGMGLFASRSDVSAIDDLESVTVFHQPAMVSSGVFTALHQFNETGEFIGIVTATVPDSGSVHTTIFPFEVGFTGIGYWPWLIALVVLLQLTWWLMNRNAAKNREEGDSS